MNRNYRLSEGGGKIKYKQEVLFRYLITSVTCTKVFTPIYSISYLAIITITIIYFLLCKQNKDEESAWVEIVSKLNLSEVGLVANIVNFLIR